MEKYPKTIVVLNKQANDVFEYYSGIKLSAGIRKSKKYYKIDGDGYYYIPEILQLMTEAFPSLGL